MRLFWPFLMACPNQLLLFQRLCRPLSCFVASTISIAGSPDANRFLALRASNAVRIDDRPFHHGPAAMWLTSRQARPEPIDSEPSKTGEAFKSRVGEAAFQFAV
jgi:hypothetical protein